MHHKSVFERIHEENPTQLTLWQRFVPRLMTGVYKEVLKKKHKLPYDEPCPFAERRQKAIFVTYVSKQNTSTSNPSQCPS
jgi:hypothetical protein